MTDLSPANIILNADSYKTSHFRQYPPETALVSSYIEARGGEYARTVFFGLQMFLQESNPCRRLDNLPVLIAVFADA